MFRDESKHCKDCKVTNEREKKASDCNLCCNCGGIVVNQGCASCGAGYATEDDPDASASWMEDPCQGCNSTDCEDCPPYERYLEYLKNR